MRLSIRSVMCRRRCSSSRPRVPRYSSIRGMGSFISQRSRSPESSSSGGREVIASISVGPPPDLARSTASRATAATSRTSLPSTTTPGMP